MRQWNYLVLCRDWGDPQKNCLESGHSRLRITSLSMKSWKKTRLLTSLHCRTAGAVTGLFEAARFPGVSCLIDGVLVRSDLKTLRRHVRVVMQFADKEEHDTFLAPLHTKRYTGEKLVAAEG